ncbi:LPS assembly lipoprotein LptE [Denitrificimonas sp. JX-1]|uniref:LPS-assembly lipoprotein LptE n=1 Tax=Denitrificimonas halotolerans TaxID=3098930 RepID=A0ABU5GQK8_9GAMM|nr:LPS assembly lipoprotein LptE [Denitrificimonas sp. JX-1]MDY7219248.1 LPS assembly lipoprotein LptE [Denitrificimonas sp. JX-1]
MLKRSITVLSLAFLLTACGFHLRGTGTMQMALTELNFAARDALSPLGKDVKSSLDNNKVQVSSSAPFTLYLGPEETSRRTASFTAGTRSAEYTLTSAFDYELRSGNLPALIKDRIEVQRTYAHNQDNITSSSQEADLLREEMRRELVMQLMMRLQAITPAQLETLKAQAERKAQAEIQAREAALREMQRTQPQQSPIRIH